MRRSIVATQRPTGSWCVCGPKLKSASRRVKDNADSVNRRCSEVGTDRAKPGRPRRCFEQGSRAIVVLSPRPNAIAFLSLQARRFGTGARGMAWRRGGRDPECPSSPVANTTSRLSRSQTEGAAGVCWQSSGGRFPRCNTRCGATEPRPPHEPPYAWALVAAPHRGAFRDGD